MSSKNNGFSRIQSSPPFHHMLRASGQSEVWYDFTDEEKFRRYGWRSSTNEDLYSNATLIGNWAEERFDTRRTVTLRRSLPHQVGTVLKYGDLFIYTFGVTFRNVYIGRVILSFAQQSNNFMFLYLQFSHYFETTYSTFNKKDHQPIYKSKFSLTSCLS